MSLSELIQDLLAQDEVDDTGDMDGVMEVNESIQPVPTSSKSSNPPEPLTSMADWLDEVLPTELDLESDGSNLRDVDVESLQVEGGASTGLIKPVVYSTLGGLGTVSPEVCVPSSDDVSVVVVKPTALLKLDSVSKLIVQSASLPAVISASLPFANAVLSPSSKPLPSILKSSASTLKPAHIIETNLPVQKASVSLPVQAIVDQLMNSTPTVQSFAPIIQPAIKASPEKTLKAPVQVPASNASIQPSSTQVPNAQILRTPISQILKAPILVKPAVNFNPFVKVIPSAAPVTILSSSPILSAPLPILQASVRPITVTAPPSMPQVIFDNGRSGDSSNRVTFDNGMSMENPNTVTFDNGKSGDSPNRVTFDNGKGESGKVIFEVGSSGASSATPLKGRSTGPILSRSEYTRLSKDAASSPPFGKGPASTPVVTKQRSLEQRVGHQIVEFDSGQSVEFESSQSVQLVSSVDVSPGLVVVPGVVSSVMQDIVADVAPVRVVQTVPLQEVSFKVVPAEVVQVKAVSFKVMPVEIVKVKEVSVEVVPVKVVPLKVLPGVLANSGPIQQSNLSQPEVHLQSDQLQQNQPESFIESHSEPQLDSPSPDLLQSHINSTASELNTPLPDDLQSLVSFNSSDSESDSDSDIVLDIVVPHTNTVEQPLITKNELPPQQQVLPFDMALLGNSPTYITLGQVISIVFPLAIISTTSATPATLTTSLDTTTHTKVHEVLEIDTPIFNKNGEFIGRINDIFGRVDDPYYSLLLTTDSGAAESARQTIQHDQVFFVKSQTAVILTTPLLKFKGSDASNLYDEEVEANELDFSDDELEREYKKKKGSQHSQMPSVMSHAQMPSHSQIPSMMPIMPSMPAMSQNLSQAPSIISQNMPHLTQRVSQAMPEILQADTIMPHLPQIIAQPSTQPFQPTPMLQNMSNAPKIFIQTAPIISQAPQIIHNAAASFAQVPHLEPSLTSIPHAVLKDNVGLRKLQEPFRDTRTVASRPRQVPADYVFGTLAKPKVGNGPIRGNGGNNAGNVNGKREKNNGNVEEGKREGKNVKKRRGRKGDLEDTKGNGRDGKFGVVEVDAGRNFGRDKAGEGPSGSGYKQTLESAQAQSQHGHSQYGDLHHGQSQNVNLQHTQPQHVQPQNSQQWNGNQQRNEHKSSVARKKVVLPYQSYHDSRVLSMPATPTVVLPYPQFVPTQQFAPQQFTPQQFTPQQFAPQQLAPQQYSPNAQFAQTPQFIQTQQAPLQGENPFARQLQEQMRVLTQLQSEHYRYQVMKEKGGGGDVFHNPNK